MLANEPADPFTFGADDHGERAGQIRFVVAERSAGIDPVDPNTALTQLVECPRKIGGAVDEQA
jgi:hypothetical protein